MNPALINVYTTPTLPPFLLGQRVEPFSVGPKPRNERLVMHILAEILRKSRKSSLLSTLQDSEESAERSSNHLGQLKPSQHFKSSNNSLIAFSEPNSGRSASGTHVSLQSAFDFGMADVCRNGVPKASACESKSELDAARAENVAYPPEAKALPPDWLLAPKSASFTQRILFRLIQAEERETDVHLRDDYRQAFICLSLASRGNTEPFLVSSYQMYGKHPDLVWPAIMAKRAAKLGKEFGQWYSTDGQLLPDVGVPKKPPTTPEKPDERIQALLSLPSLPASADGTGAASPNSTQAAPPLSIAHKEKSA